MRKAFVLAVLMALSVHKPAAQPASGCAFSQKPVILMQKGEAHKPGSRLLQFWDMEDRPILWSPASPQSSGHGDFAAKLERRVAETDALKLLAQSPTANNKLVAANFRRWIHPATCLEKLLQGTQHQRLDTFATPTEFASFVLRSQRRLRIYYYTVNQDGIGSMTPLTDPVRRDLKEGWRVLLALHNHNFHPGQPGLNGIPAPSVPDAHFTNAVGKELGLQEAWITNGVNTARIPAAAFADFEHK